MALDRGNVLALLEMVGFVAVGLYGAWRGWKGGAPHITQRAQRNRIGWTGDGGGLRSDDEDDD